MWTPAARLGVRNTATPETRGAVLRAAAPSKNVMLPVTEAGDTVAVKVTFCPTVDVVGVTVRTVVVTAAEAVMLSVTGFDVLDSFFESPP